MALNLKEKVMIVIILLILTIFSVINVGYTPYYMDDEASAYFSIMESQQDPELYKNDFYIQSVNRLPVYLYKILIKVYTDFPSLPNGDWNEVVSFALKTSKDDLFVIPAFSGSYDYSSFRFLSKRAVFIEWKGVGNVVYDPSTVHVIRERFIDYCKTDFMSVATRMDFVEACKRGYLSNTEKDFNNLNIKYGANFLIENKQETPRKLDLPIVLENDEFVIYSLELE